MGLQISWKPYTILRFVGVFGFSHFLVLWMLLLLLLRGCIPCASRAFRQCECAIARQEVTCDDIEADVGHDLLVLLNTYA